MGDADLKDLVDKGENGTVALVSPSLSHASDIFAYSRLPVFCEFIDSDPMETEEEAAAFLNSLIEQNARGERDYFVVELDGKAVGTFGLIYNRAPMHRSALIGFGLSPLIWGKNVFERASALLARYARQKGLVRLEAITRIDNKGSVNALLRSGYVEEGILRSYYHVKDEEGDYREDAHLSAMILDE